MNLVEAICDRVFMIQKDRKSSTALLMMSKPNMPTSNASLRENNWDHLKIPSVRRIEEKPDGAVLYLKKMQPAKWVKHLPDDLNINEMTIDRISLMKFSSILPQTRS